MNLTKIKTGQDILEHKLRELYDLEHHITKALGKLIKKASDEELRAGFEEHLGETEQQIERLEKAFGILESKPRKIKLEGIRGIVSDGEVMLSGGASEAVQDALMTGAARQVEHYEMACYLSAIELAELLGQSEIVRLLEESLAEEEATDTRLSKVGKKLNQGLVSTESVFV